MSLFDTQLERGKKGEEIVLRLMEDRNHSVIDVSSVEEYQKKDIDFIIDGFSCELKTDYVMHKTGNLFLESEIVYDWGKRKGYFRITEAEYLMFLDIVGGNLYIYHTSDLREYVETHKVSTKLVDDGYKWVIGYILPLTKVEHQTIKINVQ